ncbi:hypothetical protein [Planktothrix agardhii]|jgi:hypothetical protein|uniref:Uncharacterized protein n=1 Tax=Planktothrix agardhii TaxID=1160 RepID=A0AAD1Q4P6_PLAAG|nr:hypothetical protein [Planktothrix agardhii]MCF3606927.1 hypothetical protein [Planktothrix agardhii 1033]MCB8752888.1 hypothetical protein [Planktothrix agardhii 1810]MCB8759947.1 hypothetical protein [Planktothrix agardhii 1813]MCB8764289.1 hypothetical protein [Planktothrix agardhii 1809]MCB8777946.1 hypothetical protein [Planktothrix agardhii 1031]
MKIKLLTTVALVGILGFVTPVVFSPSPSVAQIYTGFRVKTDKPFTVRLINEAGKPVLFGLSQNTSKTLASGQSTVLPFSQIKTKPGEVNILVYTQDGTRLGMKPTFDEEKNELTVNISSGGAGHKNISISSNGMVELI